MVFTDFLKLMAHKNASDLFITAGVPPSLKVDGKIQPIPACIERPVMLIAGRSRSEGAISSLVGVALGRPLFGSGWRQAGEPRGARQLP